MSVDVALLFYSYFPRTGGTEIAIKFYSQLLAAKGLRVAILHPCASNTRHIRCERYGSGLVCSVCFRFIRIFNIAYRYAFISTDLISLLLLLRPRVVLVFSSVPSYTTLAPFVLKQLAGFRVIWRPSYPVYPGEYGRVIGWFRSLMWRTLVGFLARASDAIVALTNVEASILSGFTSSHRSPIVPVVVAPDPLAVRVAGNSPRDTLVLRIANLASRLGYTIVLIVARMTAVKGLHTVLEALQRVDDRIKSRLFVIVVGGAASPGEVRFLSQLRTSLRERLGARGRPRVVFTGWLSRSTLDRLYELADMVIVPSLWESFGRVIVEAMAHCRPVIASAYTNLSPMLKVYRAAVLVDPLNPDEMARAIELLARNAAMREELSRRACRFYRLLYGGYRRAYEAVANLVISLLGRRTASAAQTANNNRVYP